MKIVVAGIESIGKNLVELFVRFGHEVVVIERSEKNLTHMDGSVRYVIGDICDPKTLEEADIHGCACFLPLTLSYTANMVSSYVAKKIFNVPITIANITCDFLSNDEYNELFFKENFMIDYVLNHDKEVAQTIYNLSMYNGTFDYIRVNDIAIFAIKCAQYSDIANTPLMRLKQIAPDLDIKIISIIRDDVQIFFPKGDDEILVGDMVYVASHVSIIDKVMAIFGIDKSNSNNIIVGSNNISRYLVKLFEKSDQETLLIKDKNEEAFESNIEIVEANTQNFDFLTDFSEYTNFIAVTNNDEHNVILAKYAQKMGIERTIAYSQNENLRDLIPSKGILITSQDVVFSRIIDYLHIGDYTNLKYSDVTIATWEASGPLLDENFMEILREKNFMPLFVVRNGDSIPIDKKYVIALNDKIIFAIPTKDLKDFEEEILNATLKI